MEHYACIGKDGRRLLGSKDQLTEQLLPMLHWYCLHSTYSEIRAQKVRCMSFTTDSWTDNTSRCYIAITGHYINTSFDLVSKILEVTEVQESQTIEFLTAYLSERVDRHFPGTNMIIHSITTDNASNFRGACEAWLGGNNCIPCFAHTLNLAIKDITSRSPWCTLLDCIRRVGQAFREHKHLRYAFKTAAQRKGARSDIIPKTVVTRWSSEFNMVSVFVKQFAVLFEVKHSGALSNMAIAADISEQNFTDAQSFCAVLEPLHILSTTVQSQTVSHISEVPSWISKIRLHLTRIRSSAQITASTMADELLDRIDARFGFIFERPNPMLLAAALDPRFASLDFDGIDVLPSVRAAVDDELLECLRILSPVKLTLDMMNSMLQLARCTLREFKPSTNTPLQEFWTTTPSIILPLFKDLARMLFSAQPSSAAAESAFSTSGFFKSDLRSRLRPSMVNALTVIKRSSSAANVTAFADKFLQFTQLKEIDNTLRPSDDVLELLEQHLSSSSTPSSEDWKDPFEGIDLIEADGGMQRDD